MEAEKIVHECLFKNILSTCNDSKTLAKKDLSGTQIATIVKSSNERKDGFQDKVHQNTVYKYHTDCYATYTSKEKIKRHLKKIEKRKNEDQPEKGGKRLRR